MSNPEETPKPVVSPFAKTSVTIPSEEISSPKKNLGLILGGFLGILIIGISVFWFSKSIVSDPYRTLETFSVDKYMNDYRSLQGGRYKTVLKVQSNIGYDEAVGKLMSFTAENDSRPFVVMIPTELTSISFTKGQTYTTEIEVKEGGLIYAKSCKKN